ncbi:sulfatase family protein [Algibacillus agarilyticus]|uniref:sulfatase family protein n=1 Tax=Algibacillus agarilyticus TaxID=2234133 RepID=UPI000DD0BF9B|nr:arylsulfatase [Algibacillus agarilyticus]
MRFNFKKNSFKTILVMFFVVSCNTGCNSGGYRSGEYLPSMLMDDVQVDKNVYKTPNVVVILADDIGVGDISYYTDRFMDKSAVVRTPNLDQLAADGVWFNDAHSATALCAPTRYAVMSGNNNYRSYAPWGVWGAFKPNAISRSELTLGRVAKRAGYKTGFVGKWHLGGDFKLKNRDKIYRGDDRGLLNQVDLTHVAGGGPADMGFEYSFMLPAGIQGPTYLAYENEKWYPLTADSSIVHINENNVLDPRIISDKGPGMGDSHWDTKNIGHVISQKAVDFVNQQTTNKPFLLYYASPMAHRPHIPPATFDGVAVAGAAPSAHLDMVVELDLQVARIINALKDQGVYDNTLIIFTSDNGGLANVPASLKAGHKQSGIYRGGKNAAHEGGHRVPFIAVWPNHIPSGQFKNESIMVQDILATVAAVSGKPLQDNEGLDSNDLLPLLANQVTNQITTTAYHPREFLMLQAGSRTEVIFVKNGWKLIIDTDHKLTKFEPTALFNLNTNVVEDEKFNLLLSQPQKVDAMLAEYLTIRNSGIPTVKRALNPMDNLQNNSESNSQKNEV